jgi:Meiotically up-regulated gene 113
MGVSRDHILQEVRRTAEANGGKPLGRSGFFAETGIKESDWKGRYWARWNDVVREAGYGPNALVEAMDDETMLDQLAGLALELGRIPVVAEMRMKKRADPAFPNEKTYARFGSKSQLRARLREYSSQHRKYEPLLSLIDALGSTVEMPASRESAPDLEIGTVYLLRAGKFYKIGMSNAAGRREREIALQLPQRAAMVHVIRTDDPPGIEAYWHRRFADRRKNGEWFELSAADISAFRRRKFM